MEEATRRIIRIAAKPVFAGLLFGILGFKRSGRKRYSLRQKKAKSSPSAVSDLKITDTRVKWHQRLFTEFMQMSLHFGIFCCIIENEVRGEKPLHFGEVNVYCQLKPPLNRFF